MLKSLAVSQLRLEFGSNLVEEFVQARGVGGGGGTPPMPRWPGYMDMMIYLMQRRRPVSSKFTTERSRWDGATEGRD